MRLTVRMTNGDSYRIRQLPEGDALDLVGDFAAGDFAAGVLTFTLDPPWWAPWRPALIVHLAREHVSALELA